MRIVKCAAVAAIVGAASSALAGPIGTLTNEIYHSSAGYAKASSIPVNTTGDILLGLSATNTNYSPTYEATSPHIGTTAPFTDGLTATDGNSDISQPTQSGNALFDLNGGTPPWYVEYTLPTTPEGLGYAIKGVTVISGHQDSRVNQVYDILVSSDGVNFTSLSDGTTGHALGSPGGDFNYSPAGAGGAASSTVSPISGLYLATGVKYLEFVDQSSGNSVYRELSAYGLPVPEPASVVLFGLGAAGLLVAARRRKA